MIALEPVKTTGINLESLTATVAAVTVIASFVFGILSRYIANRITSSINKFRIDTVDVIKEELTTKMSRIESKIDNLPQRKGRIRRWLTEGITSSS